MILTVIVVSICYFMINYKSYHDEECDNANLTKCKGITVLNWLLTSYLFITIGKNILMSLILFISLWKFYKGLVKIGLKFRIERCILAVHIIAFTLPIMSGLVYIACILAFNQIAIFTS